MIVQRGDTTAASHCIIPLQEEKGSIATVGTSHHRNNINLLCKLRDVYMIHVSIHDLAMHAMPCELLSI